MIDWYASLACNLSLQKSCTLAPYRATSGSDWQRGRHSTRWPASRTLCWWVWKQALEALETVETLPRPYLPGSCTLAVDHACAIGDHVCIQREPDVSDGTRPEISPNPSNVASESHSSTASTSSVALTPSYCAAAHGFPSDRPTMPERKGGKMVRHMWLDPAKVA